MKADRVQRRVASAVLALYLVALLLIAFWPSPVDRGLSGPTGPIDRFVAWCGRHGLPWMSYGIIEWSANVIYFVPFGVLACVLVGLRRWWLA
ncbi:MAG: VanZ family protein, partial [Leifsonia sp.]